MWPPEIDILEYVINETTEFPDMIHTGVIQNTAAGAGSTIITAHASFDRTWGFYDINVNWHEDFHIYSMEWTPTNCKSYIDGTLIVNRTMSWYLDTAQTVLAGPAHLIANLAIGGSWPGFDIDDTQFPKSMEIDYIRVYQAD